MLREMRPCESVVSVPRSRLSGPRVAAASPHPVLRKWLRKGCPVGAPSSCRHHREGSHRPSGSGLPSLAPSPTPMPVVPPANHRGESVDAGARVQQASRVRETPAEAAPTGLAANGRLRLTVAAPTPAVPPAHRLRAPQPIGRVRVTRTTEAVLMGARPRSVGVAAGGGVVAVGNRPIRAVALPEIRRGFLESSRGSLERSPVLKAQHLGVLDGHRCFQRHADLSRDPHALHLLPS